MTEKINFEEEEEEETVHKNKTFVGNIILSMRPYERSKTLKIDRI